MNIFTFLASPLFKLSSYISKNKINNNNYNNNNINNININNGYLKLYSWICVIWQKGRMIL